MQAPSAALPTALCGRQEKDGHQDDRTFPSGLNFHGSNQRRAGIRPCHAAERTGARRADPLHACAWTSVSLNNAESLNNTADESGHWDRVFRLELTLSQ